MLPEPSTVILCGVSRSFPILILPLGTFILSVGHQDLGTMLRWALRARTKLGDHFPFSVPSL